MSERRITLDLPKEPKSSAAEEVLTACASISLLARAARSFGVPATVKQHPHVKKWQRGFDEATYLESFLVLNTLVGRCLKHFGLLRKDEGLAGK